MQNNSSFDLHLLSLYKQEKDWSILTVKQKEAATCIFEGKNILLTGPAGTGKSFLTKSIFSFLEKHSVYYAKTAMTGVAALNIGGITLHSWAGIGLAEEQPEELIRVVRHHKTAKQRIKDVRILFIDEISMASGELLDKIDFVFRYFRKSAKAFGGVQVVFIGDFLQLPPIFNSWNKSTKESFAFEAKSWKRGNVKTITLTEIMRQDKDSLFAKMLSQVRIGDASSLSLLKSRENANFPKDGIKAVKIFCKNIDVSSMNIKMLNSLPGIKMLFNADEDGKEHHLKFFERNCPAPKTLELKKGAQVMLVTNWDVPAGLVNGSVGIVDDMTTSNVTVRFANGQIAVLTPHKWELKEEKVGLDNKIKLKSVAYRKQIPLKLAWATTVHKQQGSTIDRAEIDVSQAFECGQVYVALSRVRNLESLSVKPFDDSVIKVNEKCLEFYQQEIEL